MTNLAAPLSLLRKLDLFNLIQCNDKQLRYFVNESDFVAQIRTKPATESENCGFFGLVNMMNDK